jgi:hypothetical protein
MTGLTSTIDSITTEASNMSTVKERKVQTAVHCSGPKSVENGCMFQGLDRASPLRRRQSLAWTAGQAKDIHPQGVRDNSKLTIKRISLINFISKLASFVPLWQGTRFFGATNPTFVQEDLKGEATRESSIDSPELKTMQIGKSVTMAK